MQKFSSQADPELLASLRTIAKQDGRHFQAVLEDAIRDYVEARQQEKPRASVMAHYQASLERNRKLGELLAK
jgi:predicted transcriptional regulator